MQNISRRVPIQNLFCAIYECRLQPNIQMQISYRCNFFAMRAWRNSGSGSSTAGGVGGPGALGGSGNIGQSLSQASTKVGTGWISELNPRKGVLTFENGGHDERVLFLASKVITLSSPY